MKNICYEYWRNFNQSVGDIQSGPSYPFDLEILQQVREVFCSLTDNPVVENISSKILSYKRELDAGVVKPSNPLIMICGLALSKRKFDLCDTVLNTIVEDL